MHDAHGWLRSSTAHADARVDAAFSRFALDEASSYRAFLRAHATALLPIEAWLHERQPTALADWPLQFRAAALEADLIALGATAPAGPAFQAPDDAASLAAIAYVLEGSRIGGAVLAKRVGRGLPRAYLASPCDARTWRRTLERLDHHIHDDQTRAAATEAALRVFARFEQAAAPSDGETPS